jgi:flagellar biosynthesis protein FliR
MLVDVLPAELFTFFMVFCRLGSAFIVMPGFGETYVTPRIRLIVAIGLAILVTPIVRDIIPPLPVQPLALIPLLAGEIAIGLFIGTIGRIIMGSLHTAGTIMSFQSGLANALTFDPVVRAQSAIPALFLSTAGLLLIFSTDLHHFMLASLVGSFNVFTPGVIPPFDDFAKSITNVVAQSFTLGFQLAAPFVTIGLVFYLAVGLLARLMPQVQVFFVALPVQIFLGFLAFSFTSSAILLWFLNRYREIFSAALGG